MCRAGARSILPNFAFIIATDLSHCRCTAPNFDLDAEGPVRRSHEHTDLLVEELELGVLWDEYGLVGDIVVSSIFVSFSQHFLGQRWDLLFSSLVSTTARKLAVCSSPPGNPYFRICAEVQY